MKQYVSTTNACKLCRPIGACLAFRGVEGAVPFLHGSQGCATYMRRYIISHFGEPIDIASSALGEKHAVFGGGPNLKQGIINVIKKYEPSLIGVATTCLTETIGDDVSMMLDEFKREFLADADSPILINTSTPSYAGTHMEGFRGATRSIVEKLAQHRLTSAEEKRVNLLPGFLSPQDIRYLKELSRDFELPLTILPDLSETLDAPILLEYPKIPAGGTPIDAIRDMGSACASIEFGRTVSDELSAALYLRERFGVQDFRIGTPIGIRESDRFFSLLEKISGKKTPSFHREERDRLIDAMVDGHKYVFGKKVVVYGEEDLVVGITSFLAEIGARPVLCATGGKSGRFKSAIKSVVDGILRDLPEIREDVDFWEIEELTRQLEPDLIMGHSKGYKISRALGIPLIRIGFPIHDRIGGQRILHIGYRGAQMLFDRVANAIIAKKQRDSDIGYGYF
ncbi:Nitrogenase FeMo-cofactor scaffold and assembly protein NifN [Dissulfuribacter thermophilus]|uniref:Nitrogenase FeMo-cofactor scaffold and assembly protein NifN n=1 Tax=Dissulfuribacter thermophilus TaxID=1156395 RepID=A0A1B9F4D8_9BACT|nr:nitrogenase component 1 [Dissulfuribacter thermophilus]OCC14798.1 Nitrogenase FeMo-cofactor scaffold and assembly protein NifN [Dissulfuribacter thermophilus]